MKWQSLAYPAAQDCTAADATWNTFAEQYSEPRRAYHSLSHIRALLKHAEAMQAYMHRRDLVEFAIWFHDVVYDTRAKDNEARSAEWARTAMQQMGVDASLIPLVEQCILATHRHEIIAPEIADLPLFLDLDLAILGSDESTYRRYSQAIREEYDWVPERDYVAGRTAVLKNFLARPVLFYTSCLAGLESRARHNIESEIRELSSAQ